MPFGINIRASGDATPYWELVERASALEIEPSIRALGYPPHITLAKYDDADVEELEAAVAELGDVPALTISFDRLGAFDPGFLILWASPKPHEALLGLHNRLHTIIDPVRCKPPYRPGSWTPHCSIALRVADSHRDAAHQMLAADFTPFTMAFDVLDSVSSPPIAIITERALAEK
ncbi:2'-5' RNA ligase family protein [Novosphingobium barchaimii]|uniref:2'-5' RNA ligase family protein n=1 Tax=Novosphingobium barchaimii TaxID=1420591 RepID=UPI0009EA97D0|nr:2'-5' RNA ligase family protein [Novosphingobium barchaimii]